MADTTSGKLLICPYCGDPQPVTPDGPDRCRSCAGLFEPLSRQATHNAMGPWFVRDIRRPHQPGCSYETLARLVQRGKVTKLSIMRGPTTRQFWTIAKRVPGIAHLLGYCHECDASVDPGDHGCHACGVSFGAFFDRNFLGLPEYRPLPWEHDAQSNDPRRAMGIHDESARTWHGLPTIRETEAIAGGGRRLSSFATDEELRGEVAMGPPVRMAPTTAPVSGTFSGAQADRSVEATTRLMRRRIARQQRTIYRLSVISSALALFALVALIGWTAASLGGPRPAAVEATVEATPVASDAGGASASDDAELPAFDSAMDDELMEPAVPDVEPVDSARAAEIEAEFEWAMSLLQTARDEEAGLSERIAACEDAIAILTSIRRHEPRALWPDGLEERIEEAQREIERLRLREFFP